MKASDRRISPEPLLDAARAFAGGTIALDPCTEGSNPTDANAWYTPETSDLLIDWREAALAAADVGCIPTVWLNPPFSTRIPWDERAGRYGRDGVAALVVSGVDYSTAWWRQLCTISRLRCELWRRWRFLDPDSGVTMDVSRSLCVWLVGDPWTEARFVRSWGELGGIVRPAVPPQEVQRAAE